MGKNPFGKFKRTTEGKVERLNIVHEYSKGESMTFPTDLKRFQDNILFSRIIIPTGKKGSGGIYSFEELNKELIKKGYSQVSNDIYSKMVDDLYKAVSGELGGLSYSSVRKHISSTTREAFEIAEERMGFDFCDWGSVPTSKLNQIYKEAKEKASERKSRYPVFEIMQELIDEYNESRSER